MVTMSRKYALSETLIFEQPKVKTYISRLCTNPLGDRLPSLSRPHTQYSSRVKKHINAA